jgi:hypothetical protein
VQLRNNPVEHGWTPRSVNVQSILRLVTSGKRKKRQRTYHEMNRGKSLVSVYCLRILDFVLPCNQNGIAAWRGAHNFA